MPDCCPWCDADETLEPEWVEMGVVYVVCTCCGQRSRIDQGAAPVKVPRPVEMARA